MTTQRKQLEQVELDPQEYQELPEEWYVAPTKEELELQRPFDVGIKEDAKKKLMIRNWIIAATLTAILAYPTIKFATWLALSCWHLLSSSVGIMTLEIIGLVAGPWIAVMVSAYLILHLTHIYDEDDDIGPMR